eukprot:GILJ01006054.1.p1 GENE.GILJ01006054.1~~GILJ01006054.1.p1  ORF type:complete len:170 (-),score=22.12 GILJ01006054.1:96-566(-)
MSTEGVVDQLLGLPFLFMRPPALKLKVPRVSLPGRYTVFGLVFLSYFLASSGIIYDIIQEPPSMGQTQDPKTGNVKPVAFMQYRLNGQYIIEGLSAGFMFAVAATGVIFLDRTHTKGISEKLKYFYLFGGLGLVIVGYNLLIVFLKIKLPGYLKTD